MSETETARRIHRNAISQIERYDELGRLRLRLRPVDANNKNNNNKNNNNNNNKNNNISSRKAPLTRLTKKEARHRHGVKCAESRADALRQLEAVKRRTIAVDLAKKCVEEEQRRGINKSKSSATHRAAMQRSASKKRADDDNDDDDANTNKQVVKLVFSPEVVGPAVDDMKKTRAAREKLARINYLENRRSMIPPNIRRGARPGPGPGPGPGPADPTRYYDERKKVAFAM